MLLVGRTGPTVDGSKFGPGVVALISTTLTAFNRGFRDYELTYRACTPTAREIVGRFLDEAGRIAKDVANRYAG